MTALNSSPKLVRARQNAQQKLDLLLSSDSSDLTYCFTGNLTFFQGATYIEHFQRKDLKLVFLKHNIIYFHSSLGLYAKE